MQSPLFGLSPLVYCNFITHFLASIWREIISISKENNYFLLICTEKYDSVDEVFYNMKFVQLYTNNYIKPGFVPCIAFLLIVLHS